MTFLWILFTMIVVGNSAVLAALLLSKSKKSRMNFFIMHLAFADLAVGLISVLTDIVWRLTVTWHAGNVACKIIRFMQVLVTYSSTYVLVALSVDRYDAITHPLNFSGSWKRARLFVTLAWLMSAVLSVPILVLYEERIVEGQAQCWIDLPERWQWQLWMSLVAVALFVVPALIITACYAVIVLTIWSKGKILTPTTRPRSRNEQGAVDGDVDTKRASSRGLIPKAKIKTVKMTFAIVFVFVLCWSPYIVFDMLQVYGHIPKTQTNIAVATFMQSLAPLNSAANPLIYCLFSTRVCGNLRKISILNWMAHNVCLCWPSLQHPLQNSASGRRCDYTTVSESLSRSSSRGTNRGNSVRFVALASKQNNNAAKKRAVSVSASFGVVVTRSDAEVDEDVVASSKL